MSGTLLDPVDARWGETLAAVPHDVYHLPAYCIADAALCGGTATAFHYSARSHTFLVPLVLQPVAGTSCLDAVSPYGYSGPVSDAESTDRAFWLGACRSLVDTLYEASVVTAFVRLHPLLPVPLDVLAEVGPTVQHGETVSIHLRLPPEEIWQRTRRDHRKQITRARAEGQHVVVDDWSLFDAWVAAYRDNMERVAASSYYRFPPEHFAALRTTLPDDLHLAVVLVEGEVIGGHLFFEHGGIVENYLGGTATKHLRRHPDKLLYDEVRTWARARGNVVHHLGGGLGGENDDLFTYKAGFGDGRHPFHTWRIVSDRLTYDELAGGHGPGDEHTEFFPSYRRRTSSPTTRAQAGDESRVSQR